MKRMVFGGGNKVPEKWKQILNIAMGSSIGVFIGYSIYEYLHLKKYPQLYDAVGSLVYWHFRIWLIYSCSINGLYYN